MVKKLIKYISKEEFEQLFAAVSKLKGTSDIRKKKYRLTILLAFEAGMRISEIVGYKHIPALTKDKIEGISIRIEQGKGRKDRIVPRPKRMNENALKLLPIDIPRRSIQAFVTRLGKKVLDKDISIHTFRHGFGSYLAEQGRPLNEIQMMMGHTKLSTTEIYLHANPKKAIEGARDVF